MTIASAYPNLTTALLLDFSNCQRLDPRISFSRSTTGSYYDGKTSVIAEQNLATYSQTFTNTAWTTASVSVTAGIVDPQGGTSAYAITEDSTNNFHNIAQAINMQYVFTPFTLSCYLKAGTGRYAYLDLGDNGNRWATAVFDLSSGTVTQVGAGSFGATTIGTVTSATNGWYRCAVTGSTNGGVNGYSYARVGLISSSTWSNASGTGGQMAYTGTTATIYAWGAQVEQRSTATSYTVTTASVITNYVPQLQVASTNSARLDYNPSTGESLGLLIEEQRTNLMLQSESFTSSPWAQVVGATATVTQSGWNVGFNIGQVVATTANGGIRQSIGGLTGGQVYTLSFYLQSTLTNIFLFTENGVAAYGTQCNVTINAVTGATSSMSGFTSVTSTAFGNGRIYQVVLPAALAGSYLGANLEWKTATVGVPFYLGRPQFEASSYSTSYIPTASAQVTRTGDNASIPLSGWFNTSQGTFYVSASYESYNTVRTPRPYLLNIIDSGNRLSIRGPNDGTGGVALSAAIGNGVSVSTLNGTGANTSDKLALSYATTASYLCTNGVSSSNNPGGGYIYGGQTTIYLGSGNGSSNQFGGWLSKVSYYQTALTTATMQSLTAN